MALPRANRLKQRRDFDAVYQKGTRRNGTYLTLRALRPFVIVGADKLPVPSTCPAVKIGISISRKVSKHAVVRNLIKRRLRASLRQLLPRCQPGWKVVIVVRPGAIECDYFQFLRELEKLLVQAEVLDGHS